jgi:hypothetical protein
MKCPECAHKLDASRIRCPYCGFANQASEPAQRTNDTASTPTGIAGDAPSTGQSSLSDLFENPEIAQAFLALESSTEHKRGSRRIGGLGKLILFAASLAGGALLTWFLIS